MSKQGFVTTSVASDDVEVMLGYSASVAVIVKVKLPTKERESGEKVIVVPDISYRLL